MKITLIAATLITFFNCCAKSSPTNDFDVQFSRQLSNNEDIYQYQCTVTRTGNQFERAVVHFVRIQVLHKNQQELTLYANSVYNPSDTLSSSTAQLKLSVLIPQDVLNDVNHLAWVKITYGGSDYDIKLTKLTK